MVTSKYALLPKETKIKSNHDSVISTRFWIVFRGQPKISFFILPFENHRVTFVPAYRDSY